MAGVDRDHIVQLGKPKLFSLTLVTQMGIAAGVLSLLYPYSGPETSLPGLHRFFAFVAMSTFVTGIYSIVSAHAFAPAYNCWAWLLCLAWQALLWFSAWADLTFNAGKMATGKDIDPAWSKSQFPKFAAAAGISTVSLILALASLVYYSKAVDRHRRSGAPYVFLGRWRRTDENPTGNPNHLQCERGHATSSNGNHRNDEALQGQSYEMHTRIAGRPPPYAKDF